MGGQPADISGADFFRYNTNMRRSKIVDTLVTERLRLRPFVVEDRDGMIALQGDPAVMRYYGNGLPLAAEQVDIVLDAHIHCRPKGYWAWAVSPADDPKCCGQVTAICTEWHHEQFIELGWLLVPAIWGQGYATEAVGVVVRHGVEELGWRKIMAAADVRNTQSERVMVKNGMRFVREEVDGYGKMRRVCTLIA